MTSDNKALGDAVDRLIPRTLSSVITTNHDHAQLRKATAQDLEPLRAAIPRNDFDIGLAAWTFVALDWHPPAEPRQMIITAIGYNLDKMTGWYTSDVRQFDEETACVRTRNSVYRLNGPNSPSPDLLRVCAWVHAAGVGEHLGVLHIFY